MTSSRDGAEWSRWPAPAKLNLFLHITGRRADGYHELQTVFQLLDWGDTLRLRVRADAHIKRVNAIAGVDAYDDLCVRAARLLQAATGATQGVDIDLEKRIPIGAGLGGGSSDAASTLVALNRLWRTGLALDELAALGATLGADVAVFVRGRSAWAEGIGEVLTPLALEPCAYVILDPRVHVPTAELFRAPELTRNTPRGTIPDFVSGGLVANSFAPVVRARFAAVDAAMRWLDQHAPARLSGSGGSVFAAVPTRAQAQWIAQQCPPAFAVQVAMGVDESPLLAALNEFSLGESRR